MTRALIEMIEHEMMIFTRQANSERNHSTKILDRSAYLLLGKLEADGPQSISSLADAFRLDASTASRQTAALVSKGLVERVPDPTDGRITILQITERGRTLLQQVRTIRFSRYQELLQDWSDEDCRQ